LFIAWGVCHVDIRYFVKGKVSNGVSVFVLIVQVPTSAQGGLATERISSWKRNNLTSSDNKLKSFTKFFCWLSSSWVYGSVTGNWEVVWSVG
jgi:hypothetical protein